jgi:hypothetical protein
MGVGLFLTIFAISLAAWADDATPRTQVVVGMRQTLFPEKDNTARLSHAGAKEQGRRRAAQNEDFRKRAETLFKESDVFQQMGLFVLPFIHGGTEAKALVEQVAGKVREEGDKGPLADFAVLPQVEWEGLKKEFSVLQSMPFKKKDGRGGDIVVVYDPDRLKQKIALFDRIDRITEAYVEDILTKKLGLHPGETSEIASKLKAQVRQTLSPRGGALRAGRDLERDFVRGLSDRFVKEYLGPELKGRWTGHDPIQAVTQAHQPGERETASAGSPEGADHLHNNSSVSIP